MFENLEGPIRINLSAQKSIEMESAFGEIRKMIAEGLPTSIFIASDLMALAFLRALPLEAPRDFQIPNAGFNWVRREGAGWVVEAWACTAHLKPGSLDELANA